VLLLRPGGGPDERADTMLLRSQRTPAGRASGSAAVSADIAAARTHLHLQHHSSYQSNVLSVYWIANCQCPSLSDAYQPL
jgi:hypothetical protein